MGLGFVCVPRGSLGTYPEVVMPGFYCRAADPTLTLNKFIRPTVLYIWRVYIISIAAFTAFASLVEIIIPFISPVTSDR